jgi:hypothetical protein
MFNATLSLLFIGALVFLFGIALAFRRSMQRRRENAVPFRGYFAAVDSRYFLQRSDLIEPDSWRNGSESHSTPFRFRDPEFDGLTERESRLIERNSESV